MHRFFLIVLALGLSTPLGHSDQQADVARNKTVRAGQTVTFTIKLDKAPSVSGGQLAIRIGPRDRSPQILARVATADANEGERELSISIPIPLGGPVGVWHVENLTFTLPNGDSRPLGFNGIDFTVLPKSDLIVPDSATLRIQ